MLLYPEVPAAKQAATIARAFVVGATVGDGCYALLGRLRRSRSGRSVAQVWAWWVGLSAGLGAAVAVAGPYVLAGRTRRGGWNTDPLTFRQVLVIAGVMAVGYALFGLRAPLDEPQAGPAWRAKRRGGRKRRLARREQAG